jgi:formylglycine-generating enzyme required for sulfatase activity
MNTPTFAFMLIGACSLEVPLPAIPVGDEVVDTEAVHEAHPDTDVPGPPPAVTVEPLDPGPLDDLRCVVSAVTEGAQVELRWLVNGQIYEDRPGPLRRPADMIPHGKQAGGQSWQCGARHVGKQVWSESAAVVVRPLVPMVLIPAGSTNNPHIPMIAATGEAIIITRPFWMATTETTWRQFESVTGYVPDEFRQYAASRTPEHPIAELNVWEAMAYTNLLSDIDGLDPCFSCTGAGADVVCERPTDPYSCEGYRLPTMAEWSYAYSEAGRHPDPLPAGGYFEVSQDSDYHAYNRPALGPFAPPNSTIRDQCFYIATAVIPGMGGEVARAVGQLLPTVHGLYDLCGNVMEFAVDYRSDRDTFISGVDPYMAYETRESAALAMGSHFSSETTQVAPRYDVHYPTSGSRRNTGLRIVRSHTPLPPGATR